MNVGTGLKRGVVWALGTVAALWMAYGAWHVRAEVGAPRDERPATRPSQNAGERRAVGTLRTPRGHGMGASTQPAMQKDLGPDVVMMKELADLYEPVPFNHKAHAQMAEMWLGCVTCHHRDPEPTTQPAGVMNGGEKTQEAAGKIPACKSCHPVSGRDGDIHMPNLKGAYHRQCLNCHQEWMGGNHCAACHKPRNGHDPYNANPTPDDIIGRMHPPIPEPEAKLYKTRFTPADGGNVLFRHKEHTQKFGLKCVDCHQRDNCVHCHDPKAKTEVYKPVRPGRTWQESHGPCMNCHMEDRCVHCHYKDDQQPPPVFEHSMTGQVLDKDHVELACYQCHGKLKYKLTPSCGDSTCHEAGKAIAFPAHRPGPQATTRPASSQPAMR